MRLSVDLMATVLLVTQKPQPLVTTDVITTAEVSCIFFLTILANKCFNQSVFSILSYD